MFAYSRKLLNFLCLVQIASIFNCSYRTTAYAATNEIFRDKSGNDVGKNYYRELKPDYLYEDFKCVAVREIRPQAPVHFLVVPKKTIDMLSVAKSSDESLLGHLLLVASKVAKKQGLTNGFRVVVNDGKDGGQSIDFLHLHVLGGRQMLWPPG